MKTKQLDFTTLFSGDQENINSRKAIPESKSEPEPAKSDDKLIALLRKAAAGLQNQIDQKLNPAISDLRPTARRARIADGMAADGRRLQEIQAKLYALADAHEAGTIHPALTGIRFKSQIEAMIYWSKWPDSQWPEDTRKLFAKAGITLLNFHEARTAFAALTAIPQEDPVQVRIKKLERDLLGHKIPGFFPTPKPLAEYMVQVAGIEPGQTILEPSAGKGNIAEIIRDWYPENPLGVIERQSSLREILKLKGFELTGWDFLECYLDFDRIIQNPPFEQFQDIQHVQHAYNLLRPGGRLVSIMSPGPFFRQDQRAKGFQKWFGQVGGYAEDLPPDSFRESGTGVAARLVMIDK